MTDEEVEQLLLELQPTARRMAQRHFRDPALVEDAVQAHALDVWAIRHTLDPQRNPRALALARMGFVCLRIKQRQFTEQPKVEELTEAVEPATATGDENSHLRDMDVRRAFDRLPSHLWVVAWLVHGEGFLASEAAKRLGLPRMLAEQRLVEATRLLQGMLKGWR